MVVISQSISLVMLSLNELHSISLLMLSLNELHSPAIGTNMSLGISVDATSYSLRFDFSAAFFAIYAANALLGILVLE
jgi:hypothetical protein